LKGVKLVFGLICEDVRFELNGRISIIGEGNIFYLSQVPATLPLCILTKWAGPPGDSGLVALQMISPDSTMPVLMCQQEIELSMADLDTSFGGTVNKLPWQIQTTGVHQIRILFNGEEYGRIDLMIKKENL